MTSVLGSIQNVPHREMLVDPENVNKIFRRVFEGQFINNHAHLSRKMDFITDTANTWNGTELVD